MLLLPLFETVIVKYIIIKKNGILCLPSHVLTRVHLRVLTDCEAQVTWKVKTIRVSKKWI